VVIDCKYQAVYQASLITYRTSLPAGPSLTLQKGLADVVVLPRCESWAGLTG